MRQPLTAYSSPWRMALMVFGSVVFVAIGVWMTGLFGEPPESRRWSPGLVQSFGWFSIVFFGACAIVGIRRAVDTDVQLRISEQGIYWTPWSEKTIPWYEIRDVRMWEHRRQRMIILCLTHPERYPSMSLLGKFAALNRGLTGGDIAISLTGTDKSFDEALGTVEEFRAAHSLGMD